MQIYPTQHTCEQFGIPYMPSVLLQTVEMRTYATGEYILKHVKHDKLSVASELSDINAQLQGPGFTKPQQLKTRAGYWVSDDGFLCYRKFHGHHSYARDAKSCIAAIQAYSTALAKCEYKSTVLRDSSIYALADQMAWGELPPISNSTYKSTLAKLLSVNRCDIAYENTLIHGDLNPENILIAHNKPPCIIDLTPYFRPVDFALAVYAYWIGPYNGDIAVLESFAEIPNFRDLLVKAALRMTFVKSLSQRRDNVARFKKAAEIVLEFCKK